jgi:hypothetical protein
MIMSEDSKETSIETSLALLNHRVEVMHEDFTEMRTVLKELTTAINKLTVVEERQTQFADAQERAFKVIGKIEERVTALEKRVPENDRIKVWVDRAVVAVLGVVFLYAVKHLGLM